MEMGLVGCFLLQAVRSDAVCSVFLLIVFIRSTIFLV